MKLKLFKTKVSYNEIASMQEWFNHNHLFIIYTLSVHIYFLILTFFEDWYSKRLQVGVPVLATF